MFSQEQLSSTGYTRVGIFSRGDEVRVGDIAISPINYFYEIISIRKTPPENKKSIGVKALAKAKRVYESTHEAGRWNTDSNVFYVEVCEVSPHTAGPWFWQVTNKHTQERNDLGAYEIWRKQEVEKPECQDPQKP